MNISHSTPSSFLTNWVKDGIAFSIGVIGLKIAKTSLFKIEQLSLKTISLLGAVFCLGTSLGRHVINPFDPLLFSHSSPSHREWIEGCFKGILLTTAASLPIFALHLAGRLFTLPFFSKISFKETLALATIGGGTLILAQPFRFIYRQSPKEPLIPPRKPTHLKPSQTKGTDPIEPLKKEEVEALKKKVSEALKTAICKFQVTTHKPFKPNFVKTFIHGFFFHLYYLYESHDTTDIANQFLNQVASFEQSFIDTHVTSAFKEAWGKKSALNKEFPCEIFFKDIYEILTGIKL